MPARPAAVTKAIVLASGEDTPLYPLTQVVARELLPVYDKPMIYYPISALMFAGVREMLVVSPLRELRGFMELLGNGSRLGVSFSYEESPEWHGHIAHNSQAGSPCHETFLTAESFIDDDPVALVHADTILLGRLDFLRDVLQPQDGATVLVVRGEPSARHALVEWDGGSGAVHGAGACRDNRQRYVAAGISVYDGQVIRIVKGLFTSGHETPTLIDINREYLRQGRLHARRLPREVTYLDGSDPSDLLKASNLVARFEERNGCKIGCLEEAAFRMGYITAERLRRLVCDLPQSNYREYLSRLAANAGRESPNAEYSTQHTGYGPSMPVAQSVR
jgi:glucose-1-phosphate thymidylyltransferase